MKTSFKNFMTGLIDYAGLFPPASLDLDTALRSYAGYLAGEHGWMLGRFVVPATQLHRVVPAVGFRFSVIVSPGVTDEEIERLAGFSGAVETVEARLADATDSPVLIADQLLHIKSRLDKAGLRGVQLFLEAGSAAAQAIASFNRSGGGGEVIEQTGYKLRCGGMEKQAFPAPEKVAEAIGICLRNDIAIKFTAGLHHPVRHYDPEIGVVQHGFVNVFGAALLSWGGTLSFDETVQCLCDDNAGHFDFTDEGFSWRDKTISAGEMKTLRQSKAVSFGSCSFAEPVEGLHALGFLGNDGA